MLSQATALRRQANAEAVPMTLLEVFGHLPLERVKPGTPVFWQGDQASAVFEIVEGVLRTFKILADGRRVITGFLYPGDIVGVSLRDRYLYSAEAVVPAKLRRFARARFEDEIEHRPELRPQLFARLCDEMAAAQDQMVLLACKSAEERVASFLLSVARRTRHRPAGNSAVIEIPMTRLDMADYLGLTIETVSRTMTKLTARAVIAPAGRHTVALRNMEQLASLAGDDDELDNDPAGSTGGMRPWSH
jgi:CRP/FNR family transcriptional regulator